MALSAGDLAECKDIAREIIKEVLIEHIKGCPHGMLIQKGKAFLIGACIGSGCAGGGLALAISQILTNSFGG